VDACPQVVMLLTSLDLNSQASTGELYPRDTGSANDTPVAHPSVSATRPQTEVGGAAQRRTMEV
jgi:hypothetical protein